jgi:hypothetical protein
MSWIGLIILSLGIILDVYCHLELQEIWLHGYVSLEFPYRSEILQIIKAVDVSLMTPGISAIIYSIFARVVSVSKSK